MSVQLRPGEELRRFSESGAGFGGLETIPYERLAAERAAAPRPGGRGAPRPPGLADRLPRPHALRSGELTWGAYFKGGAIFLADERGKITRRLS